MLQKNEQMSALSYVMALVELNIYVGRDRCEKNCLILQGLSEFAEN